MKKSVQSLPDQDDFFSFDDLPQGWACRKLGEMVLPSKEKIEPTADSTLPYIGLEHIESNSSKIIGHGIASDAKSTKTVFHAGDVLYGKLRPYLNKVAIPDFDGVCSTDILVFNQNQSIDSRYLMRYLSTREVVEYANLKSKGISLPRVNFESLAEISIPLPPLAKQQRIVARVEALLSHVNAARDWLSRVPLIMKKFRQAVLAAACSGRLTEGWREENPDVESAAVSLENISVKRANKKIEHLKKMQPLNDELGNLPNNWTWTQIGFITESMKNGVYKEPKYYKDDGFPCLRMYNIEDGKIIWKNIKHMDLTDDEIKTYLLKPNDILINRVNSRELVGKSALITEKIEPCIYESKNIRLRMYNEEINSQYVVYWLQVNAQKFFNLNAQQTVGMASINQDQIASMSIPLPPLAEQHEIVRRVGMLFKRADAIEREVEAASRRCDAMTQAILAKAFKGDLVTKS
jgi:type I restriction enzyme S subunit